MRGSIRFTVVALFCLFTSLAFAQYNNTQPRDGACFYTDFNFRGESFCMNAGQNADRVPSNFNDRIRSIRVFGRARVQFYNDSNYGGTSGSLSRDISDLRTLPLQNVPGKNWATRISSLQVSGGGFGGFGGNRGDRDDRYDRDRDRDRDRDHDWDRDRDRDRNRDGWRGNNQTVSCSSDVRKNREWCRTPGSVSRVRVVNQNGRTTCEWNQTYGIDNGRLWVGRGCSGTFEIMP